MKVNFIYFFLFDVVLIGVNSIDTRMSLGDIYVCPLTRDITHYTLHITRHGSLIWRNIRGRAARKRVSDSIGLMS